MLVHDSAGTNLGPAYSIQIVPATNASYQTYLMPRSNQTNVLLLEQPGGISRPAYFVWRNMESGGALDCLAMQDVQLATGSPIYFLLPGCAGRAYVVPGFGPAQGVACYFSEAGPYMAASGSTVAQVNYFSTRTAQLGCVTESSMGTVNGVVEMVLLGPAYSQPGPLRLVPAN